MERIYDLKDSMDITKLLLLVETLLYIAFIGNNFMSNKTFIIVILFLVKIKNKKSSQLSLISL